ncbi:DUF2461 domain-containing protein [Aquihabitans sp. McL0605]|uniref:DUF2461 domain-containing protein n=1 Tax=Aquihabitans sp. McL0605 TaxID=3415671 RepID=UPI003CFB99DD
MSAFRGWPPSAIDFYRQLEAENTRPWWLAHKATFDADVRAPFDALSDLVAHEFGPLKVFRPNRDTRFSKDKSPYKTACYAVGEGPDGEGYYVGISARGLAVGAGFWMMAPDQLERYRRAVDDDGTGDELAAIVADLERQKLAMEGEALKTAPRGYPRDHPRIELLRRKSVAGVRSWEPAAWFATKAAATKITGVWRTAAPLNAWLAAHVGPSTAPPDSRW